MSKERDLYTGFRCECYLLGDSCILVVGHFPSPFVGVTSLPVERNTYVLRKW